MYRLVNIFAGFQNPTRDAGWQVWRDDSLIAVCRTRSGAKAFIKAHQRTN